MACHGCRLVTHPLAVEGTAGELAWRARQPMHRIHRMIILRAAEKAATSAALKLALAAAVKACRTGKQPDWQTIETEVAMEAQDGPAAEQE